ncbi:MAG: hypothetical protein ACRC1H_07320, partial [Caldilineaceae bacterium]
MAQAITRPAPTIAASTQARPVLLLSFVWMLGGMLITTATAWWAIESGTMNRWAAGNPWFWVFSMVIWIAISLFFATLVRRVS